MRLTPLLALTLLGCAATTLRPTPSTIIASGEAKQERRTSGLRACDTTSECSVVPTSCCGHCGAAARGDAIAVNTAWWTAHGSPHVGCDDPRTGCPACAHGPDPELLATCRRHRCVLTDLARSPLTRCTADTDCVTSDASCCGCGDTAVVVARGQIDAFRQLFCSVGEACETTCPPGDGADAEARCVEGHCRLPESIDM
jgi:hypothetical protein